MKYKNKRSFYNGKFYHSKKEADRACQLNMLLAAGHISDLKEQVPFKLEVNSQLICRYIADFVYIEGGKQIVEDCKSAVTAKLPVYRIKKKLMLALLNIDILET